MIGIDKGAVLVDLVGRKFHHGRPCPDWDYSTRLADENREVLAENARLCRELDRVRK